MKTLLYTVSSRLKSGENTCVLHTVVKHVVKLLFMFSHVEKQKHIDYENMQIKCEFCGNSVEIFIHM